MEESPAGPARPHNTNIEVPILIPAYQPGEALDRLIGALLSSGGDPIILVDDGSGPAFASRFERLARRDRVYLLRHAVNLGKGAALKTGMNFALVHFPNCAGVVTADADGQHAPEDILGVAKRLGEDAGALLLGVRQFQGEVPLRSRFGNSLTRALLYLVAGQKLADTQTGLRGIPAALAAHLLRVPSSGYEFELDMLMACKYQGFPIAQIPIRTIYENGNKSSHFHPIFDSMRIYFLLLRFSVLSLLTAILDNLIFAVSLGYTARIGESQLLARLVAMVFNYLGARGAVFHSRQRHAVVFPKYAALVAANGFLSYALLELLHLRFGWPAIPAKLAAEGILFIANFAIQRDFVFTRRPAPAATDWDSYYKNVPATAKLTRKYTASVIVGQLRSRLSPPATIVEIGGANSCFLDAILAAIGCSAYHVIDTNRYGLSLLSERAGEIVHLHQQSVLSLDLEVRADAVFSAGLIEHFSPEQTRQAILAHFRLVKPGGIVLITFPTPTLLYRLTRGFLEAIGQWKFPDERPLGYEEVLAAVGERGEVVFRKTLWPLMLTQGLIVAREIAAQSGYTAASA